MYGAFIGLGLYFAIIRVFTDEYKDKDDTNKTPETEIEKVSYCYGVNVATYFQSQGLDSVLVSDIFYKAFTDVFNKDTLDISIEDGEKILMAYFDKIEEEKKEKELSENRKLIKESNGGEIILSSGLKLMIIEDKDGLSPQLSDTVTTEILITDIDGNILQEVPESQTVMLSEFPIPILIEGIHLMSLGDKWKLTVPAGVIAEGAVIFQIELLGIN